MVSSRTSEIYAWLKIEIISHRIYPSTQISIESLSDQFRVSAIPVREALSKLCGEGLTIQENRQGFAVRPVTSKTIEDDYRTLFAIMLIGALTLTDRPIEWDRKESRLQQNFESIKRISETAEVDKLEDILISCAGSERLTNVGLLCREQCRFLAELDIELRGAEGYARYTMRRQRAAAALVQRRSRLVQKLIVEERDWRLINIPNVVREMLYRQKEIIN